MVAELKQGEILDISLLANLCDEVLEHAQIQSLVQPVGQAAFDPYLYNKIIQLFYKDC